jgi:mono/diheme cytochrome c family protein/sugar lactone lactonase YvrE
MGPDDALYVADDVSGRIYRIVYRGSTGSSDPQIVPCPSPTEAAGPIAAARVGPPEGTHPDAGAELSSLPAPAGATPAMVALGDRVYHGLAGGATCTGCHGADATGSALGPDLTANKWLWSDGSYVGITTTIAGGVAQPKRYRSPMPAMGGAQLSSDQVMAVSAYIWALNHRAKPAAGGAGTADLVLPGERIFPESITSSVDGRIFIGSIGARRIFVVKPGASVAEGWTETGSDSTLGVFGVYADDKSSTLWACFSAFAPNGSPAAMAGYDLQSGKVKARYVLPTAGAFCNDIAVGSDGTVYVTDTSNNEVDRLKAGEQQLAVWAGNGAFGPKGSAVDGISILGNRIFINTLNSSKIFGIDIAADGGAGAIGEVKLDRAIERPDGMRSYGGSLLLVESGGVGRLARLKISGDSGTLTTLKEGYPGGPVSVTVVGTTGYVLEGQLKLLRNAGAPTNPFRATALNVGSP